MTATPGTDYTAGSGTLSFAAGDTSEDGHRERVHGDVVDEPDETLTVTLSSAGEWRGARHGDGDRDDRRRRGPAGGEPGAEPVLDRRGRGREHGDGGR